LVCNENVRTFDAGRSRERDFKLESAALFEPADVVEAASRVRCAIQRTAVFSYSTRRGSSLTNPHEKFASVLESLDLDLRLKNSACLTSPISVSKAPSRETSAVPLDVVQGRDRSGRQEGRR
jgi:hypothetical protein